MTGPRPTMIAAAAVASLSIAASPAQAGVDACPAPVENHIPKAPEGALNLGTIKELLLEYHQKYYDLDVAAVFEATQKYIGQNGDKAKKPALVLDIDETSLTNGPNLLTNDFGFVAGGVLRWAANRPPPDRPGRACRQHLPRSVSDSNPRLTNISPPTGDGRGS